MSALAPALAAAAGAGLLGGVHCAAMCGPLAIAGCRGGRQTAAYFAGRTAAYAASGALVGALGKHALCILPVARVRLIAAIAVGAALAWRGLRLLRPPAARAQATIVPARRLGPSRLARLYRRLPRRGLGLGLVTPLLPCGMLVPAWLLAAGTASAPSGALVLATFSLASAPGLLAPLLGRDLLRRLGRRTPARAVGVAWCLLALWVALRPVLGAVHHH